MIIIKVSDRIIKHCQQQIDKYNFGQRSEANGTKEQQLTGIIGQCVIMEAFNMPLINGADGFDDGIDILYKHNRIDVKTMGRTTDVKPNYVNNFLKAQDHFSTDIYIFCSYHKTKKQLTVCGYIDKDDFIKKRSYFKKGSTRTRADNTTFKTFADMYEIQNSLLNNVNNFEQLKKELQLTLKRIEYRLSKAKKNNKPVKLKVGTVLDPDKFINSHLIALKNNPKKKLYVPFYSRLVELLKCYEKNK